MSDSPITDPQQPYDARLTMIRYIINATPAQIADFLRSADTDKAEARRDLKLYTFREASKILGVSRMTLWRMVKQGKIDTVQTTGINRRIPGPAIQKYISGE